MAIFHRLDNIDNFYEEINEPIVVNDLDRNDKNRELIMDHLRQKYDSTTDISTIASCKCGESTDNFRKGTRCPICHTIVESPNEGYEPKVWMRSMVDLKFINPKIWLMINKSLGRNMDTLRYLSDGSYKPRGKMKPYIKKLIESGDWDRSYRHLHDNFLFLLRYLSNSVEPKVRPLMTHIMKVVNNNPDEIFSVYLPTFAKKIFVQETVHTETYTDLSVGSNISLVMKFTKAVESESDYEKQRAMSNSISILSEMCFNYYSESLGSKEGGSRAKIHSTRIGFGGRGGGTSITHRHHIEQVELPWRIGLVLFRAHIINKLLKSKKFTMKAIHKRLVDAYNTFDPVINDIFIELVKESKFDAGINILLQRNPTLNQASDLSLFVPFIKTDVKDNSIGISVLLMTWLAGDFDGDEYNIALPTDNAMSDAFMVLRPSTSVMSQDSPGTISGIVGLTKATNLTLARMIQQGRGTEQKNTVFK